MTYCWKPAPVNPSAKYHDLESSLAPRTLCPPSSAPAAATVALKYIGRSTTTGADALTATDTSLFGPTTALTSMV